MSRFTFLLPAKVVTESIRVADPAFPDLSYLDRVEVAIGWDDPCHAYFLDVFVDEDEDYVPGIYTGYIGTNTKVSQDTFAEVLRLLAEKTGSRQLDTLVHRWFLSWKLKREYEDA